MSQIKQYQMKHTGISWEQKGLEITAFGRGIIATCPTPKNGGVFECTANAKLISAAPDLLQALQEFMLVINRSSTALEHYGDAIKRGEAAINKAF